MSTDAILMPEENHLLHFHVLRGTLASQEVKTMLDLLLAALLAGCMGLVALLLRWCHQEVEN